MKPKPGIAGPTAIRTSVIILAAALWTLLVIQFSSGLGRLAHEAACDDCLYMFDAWWRLIAWDREGLLGFLKDFEGLRTNLILLGFSLTGLFVMAVGQLSTPFFGLTFHILLVLAAMTPAGILLSQGKRGIRTMALTVLAAITIVNFVFFQTFTQSYFNPKQVPVMSITGKRHSIPQERLDELEKELLPRSYIDEKHVFVAFVGSVSSGGLQWAAAKRGIPVRFSAFDRNEGMEAHQEAIRGADYVITAAAGAPELSGYLPAVRHHAAVHEWCGENPQLTHKAVFETYRNGHYHLYTKRQEPE